jgi:hypothetical protein
MAAPTIVAGATKLQQTTNATNHVINTPTHSSGNVIYIAACVDSGTVVTKPTDFSILHDAISVDSGAAQGFVWYKPAGGSEPGSYTYTLGTSERSAAIAWAVAGDGGIDAQGVNATGSGTTATVPAVVATQADCLRISIVFVDFGNTTTPHGTATNGHSDIDEAGATSGGALSVHYKTLVSSGSDSSATVSLNATEGWVGVAFAIAPAAASVTVAPAAASVASSAVAPTVVRGSLSIAPGIASAVATALAPAVINVVTLTPSAAQAATSAVSPTVALGSTSASPSAASVVTSAVAPTVVLGSIVVSPAVASISSSAVAPTVVLGSITISPGAASAATSAVAPSYLVLFIAVALTLPERDLMLAVGNRELTLTVQDRDLQLSLSGRDLSLSLQERDLSLTLRV